MYIHPKIKAALSLTHGEGFGLPLFEAAYMGIPVVAPGWSGQLDFLCNEEGKNNFYNVSFDLVPIPENVVWDGVLIKDSMWAGPREQGSKTKMRECYEATKEGDVQTHREYAKELASRFSEEKMYKEFIDAMGIDEEEFNVESWLDGLDIEEID
jgi:glycosyltransferase involved in cell wall biosynthesis